MPEDPVDDTTEEPGEAAEAESGIDATGPTRRERRARRGAESAVVPGRAAGRRAPVPPKARDYAARRRG